MISFLIIALILSTCFSFFVSLSQVALFSLPSSEVKLYQQGNRRKQEIAKLLAHPRELLVTLMISDIGINVLIQNIASKIFENSPGWLFKVGIPLAITLILGETIPKTIALPNNRKLSYYIAPYVHFLERILGPVRNFTTRITTWLSRFLFFFLRKEKEISEDELKHVVQASHQKGILTLEENKLVNGYLTLAETSVKGRMRPREEILLYDLEEPLNQLDGLFSEKQCSRIPVCKGDLQHIQGILSAETYFLHRQEITRSEELLRFVQKPFFVPETISAKALLRSFREQSESLAMVVDEYGTITGLITNEDLFEVVVGDITDLRDEKSRYTFAGKNVLITSGKMEIAEFEEIFGASLPSENEMVTVGGWLTEQLGDIPKNGTKYTWKQFLFLVLSADETRIRRLYIRKMRPHE